MDSQPDYSNATVGYRSDDPAYGGRAPNVLSRLMAREHLSIWSIGMAAIAILSLVGMFAYYTMQVASKKPAHDDNATPLAQGSTFQPGVPRAAAANADELAAASAARAERRAADPQNLFALRPEIAKSDTSLPAVQPANATGRLAVSPSMQTGARTPENTASNSRTSFAAACDGASDRAACEVEFCAKPENAERNRCKRQTNRTVAPEERILN